MLMPAIYLVSLVIAPQLWLGPFVGVRVDYLIYPIWLLLLVITGKTRRIVFNSQEKFFVLWILWMFITVVINGEFSLRQNLLIDYVKWFVLFLFVQASLDTGTSIKMTIRTLVFLSLILGIEGIQHFINDIGWAGQTLGWASEGVKGRTRWVGIFDGPGVFCVVYTMAVPFTLHYLASAKTFFHRCIAFASNGILAVAIYFNGSRGGFIATLCIIFLYVIIKSDASKRMSRIIAAGLIVLFLFLLAPSHITNLSDQQHSSSHRVEMWASGCDMFKNNPVFGVGRGAFIEYSGRLVAHNSFVEIMAETGFIGLFLWIGLLYMCLKGLVASCSTDNEETRSLALPLTLCIVGYLVSAMFVTLEYETLYFLLALSRALTRYDGVIDQFDGNDLKRIFVIVVTFIVSINLFVVFLGPSAFS